jgi:hypothetical protein
MSENDASHVLNESKSSALECIDLIDDMSNGAVIDPFFDDVILTHSRYCTTVLQSKDKEIINLMRDCKERLLRAHSLIEIDHPGFLARLELDRPRYEENLKKRKHSSV